MYSRFLQYSQPALKARDLCLVQNQQKDIVIATLKAQIYPLRNLEMEFLHLNNQIGLLEERYSLLMEERDRAEREQRAKSDLDRTAIVEIKTEIDTLRAHLQRMAIDIEESLRENSAMKRMCEARANEIQTLLGEQRDLDGKNQRHLQENKNAGQMIKGLKDERKKLEDDCDALSGLLEEGVNKLKNLERAVRNAESTSTRLEKTLSQAENDHAKLQGEYKQKAEELRKAQNKDKESGTTHDDLKSTYSNLVSQLDRNRSQAANAQAGLQTQILKGKDLFGKIGIVEVDIREREEELERIAWEENKLRNQHMDRLQDNRILNSEIDRLLAIIHQYQLVNSQLLEEIEVFVEQDMQARSILDRRDQMKDTIQKAYMKINTTGQPIRLLKTHFDH